MPDIYTHILNGIESLRYLDDEHLKAVKAYEKPFYLGCMGPDIFLYYYKSPLAKGKNVVGLGGSIHRQHCGEFILESLRYIKDAEKLGGNMAEGKAYFLGYLCHYSMDRTAHPFIFSRSGIIDTQNRKTRKYGKYHKITELAIDCHMAKLYNGGSINKLKLYKYLDVGKNLPASILQIYRNGLEKFFIMQLKGIDDDGNFINQAYRCFKNAWRFFYDPYHVKKSLLGILGFGFLFHPKNPLKKDYMNEQREEWVHPCSGEINKRTFIEIFNESVKLSASLLNSAINYLDNKISLDELKQILGNYSFLTNTDVTNEVPQMRYYRII